MHVVLIPSWYSNNKNKVLGSFFKEQGLALKESGLEITICYNEIIPIYEYKILGNVFKDKISFDVEDGLDTYRYTDFNYLLHSVKRFDVFSKRIEKLIHKIILNKGKIDLLHFHSCYWAGISASYIKQKFKIPYILTEHTSFNYSKRIKKSYKSYIKKCYEDAGELIAVSNSLRNEMKQIANREIRVIHNFIDEDIFKIDNVDRTLERKFVKIFSLGFLVDGKGFEDLIECAKLLLDKGYDIKLEIGGDGYLKTKLEKIIISYNIEDKVVILGMLSREMVVQKMKSCDFFVLASEYETFGVVYIEALSLGKPVIGFKNGGAEDIILSDDVGILVENKNKLELYNAMEYLVNNFKKYDNNKIRRYFLDNFGKNKIITQLKDVYKNCLIIQEQSQ